MDERDMDVVEIDRAEEVVELAARQWAETLLTGDLERAGSYALVAVAVARYAEAANPNARSRW